MFKKISILITILLSVLFSIIPSTSKEEKIENNTKEYIKPKIEEKITEQKKEVKESVRQNNTSKEEVRNESIKHKQITTSETREESTNLVEEQVEAKNDEPIVNNPETPKQVDRHIWDELGISEYDYYNSPMPSWMTVDFSVNTYGSMDAAKTACVNKGFSYEPYLNGEESFNCEIVTSYSGNNLGYMFYTRKTY